MTATIRERLTVDNPEDQMRGQTVPFVRSRQVWPDVKINIGQNDNYKISPKVSKYLGYFCYQCLIWSHWSCQRFSGSFIFLASRRLRVRFPDSIRESTWFHWWIYHSSVESSSSPETSGLNPKHNMYAFSLTYLVNLIVDCHWILVMNRKLKINEIWSSLTKIKINFFLVLTDSFHLFASPFALVWNL